MVRRFFILTLIFSSIFISCARVTDEFNFIDEKDDNYKYYACKMTAVSGDYTISFYSGTKSSYGGYGSYGQLIRDYSSGDLASIVKNDDSCFSIKSNGTDARGMTTNSVTFEISFPERKLSSVSIKANYTAPENSYMEKASSKTPLGLTEFKVSYLPKGAESETTVSEITQSKFSSGQLEASAKLDASISYIKISASMSKYYGSSLSEPFKDLSNNPIYGILSLYKVILE